MSILSSSDLKYLEILEELHKTWTPHHGQLFVGKQFYSNPSIATIFLQCARKWGKMLCVDTPIPTPLGFVRNGDLKDGDEVFDEKGRIQTVIKAHPIEISSDPYRVWFGNGTYIDACKEHLWFTYTKLDRSSLRRFGKDRSSAKNTEEIYNSQMHGKENNHSIPYTKPLEYAKKQDLPIPPYTLGAWLGDGTSANGGLTGYDPEVWVNIELDGFKVSHSSKTHVSHYIKNLKQILRESKLLNNKHIPHDYLIASTEDRLSLLQGLMDTDGTINTSGNHCTFDNSNKDLTEGVFHLVASLGMSPSRTSRIPICNGKPGKVSYRIRFRPLMNVFRIERKKTRMTPFTKAAHHKIVKVEKIAPVAMRCITVSGSSHLYLAGEALVPTHNSEFVIYFLWRHAMMNPGASCYYFAPLAKQAKEIVWAERRLQNFGPYSWIAKIDNNEMRITFTNKSFIKVDGSDSYEAYRGTQPSCAVYDEFKDFHPQFHEGMGPNLAVKKAPLLIIGTPPRIDARNFAQYIQMADECKERNDTIFLCRPTKDNPIISAEWLEREKEKLVARGEVDVYYREYEARMVTGGKRAVFPMFNRETFVRPHDEVIEEIKRDYKKLEWFISVDPGTTTCFAALFGAIHPYTKKIYLLDCIYEKSQANTSVMRIFPRINEATNELYPGSDILDDWFRVIDEAAAWATTEILNQYGVYFHPTQKSKNKKEDGISLIKDIMLQGMIVMSDRVEALCYEMETYISDDLGRFPKKNDHLIDCFRYLLGHSNYDSNQMIEAKRNIENRGKTLDQDLREGRIGTDWTALYDFED